MRLSNTVMAEWGTDVWIGRNERTLNKVGVTRPCTEDKVPVVDITKIDISNLRTEWDRIPQWHKLSENGRGALCNCWVYDWARKGSVRCSHSQQGRQTQNCTSYLFHKLPFI